jgi:hypothetical protein
MSKNASPFLKRVLIPFWVLRLLFMILTVAVYAFSLAVIASIDTDDLDSDSRLKNDSDQDLQSAKTAALAYVHLYYAMFDSCKD